MSKFILFTAFFFLCFNFNAFSQSPQSFKYQGVARNTNGAEISNGAISLRFSILEGSINGPVLYQETQNLSTNLLGLFTASLGTGFVAQGVFNQINWASGTKFLKVELDANGGANFSDMGTTQFLSVPYALFAQSAGSVANPPVLSLNGNDLTISGGNTITLPSGGGTNLSAGQGISITNNTINNTAPDQILSLTGGGITSIAGAYPNFTINTTPIPQVLNLNGNVLSLSGNGGNVTLPSGGGGTLNDAYNFGGAGAGRIITANSGAVEINTNTNNQAGLRVNQNANGAAIVAANTLSTTTFPTIQATTASSATNLGAVTGSTSGAAFAIAGQVEANATAFAAVLGSNLRTNGGPGVFGQGFNGAAGEANNVLGFGVFGENLRAANGVRASNQLAAGMGSIGFVGVLGQTQTNDGVGVLGINVAPNLSGTFDNTGVEGQGFVGMLGRTNSMATSFGVLADGDIGGTQDIFVLGMLTANGGKNFLIDHPFDPENKFIRHSSIESNEILNLYRGIAVLDQNGAANIQLPDYFEAINKNFSYQLTSIGVAGSGLYVKEEIQNNQFVIAGGQSGQKVSWQVVAERNDIYMQKNPDLRNDQPDKKSHQKGKYMYAEGYGMPAEKSMIYIPSKMQKEVLKIENTVEKTPLSIRK